MINTNIIPARNLQKSYKSIIEEVKNKKQAVVLTTNNQPQAAIVSLEDLEKLHIEFQELHQKYASEIKRRQKPAQE